MTQIEVVYYMKRLSKIAQLYFLKHNTILKNFIKNKPVNSPDTWQLGKYILLRTITSDENFQTKVAVFKDSYEDHFTIKILHEPESFDFDDALDKAAGLDKHSGLQSVVDFGEQICINYN